MADWKSKSKDELQQQLNDIEVNIESLKQQNQKHTFRLESVQIELEQAQIINKSFHEIKTQMVEYKNATKSSSEVITNLKNITNFMQQQTNNNINDICDDIEEVTQRLLSI